MMKRLYAVLVGCCIAGWATGQTISVSPCACSNNANGNGTGQFNSTIQVNGNLGDAWVVVAADSFYQTTSGNPPVAPDAILPGTPLTDLGTGVYELSGRHIDGMNFSVVVTNGTDTLSANGICYYPQATIDGLYSDYCQNSAQDTVTITGAGVGSFFLDGLPSGIFDPSTLALGWHYTQVLFDGDSIDAQNPGCINNYLDSFNVHPSPDLTATTINSCLGDTVDLRDFVGGETGGGVVKFARGNLVVQPKLVPIANDSFTAIVSLPYFKGCYSSVQIPLNLLYPTADTQDVVICNGQTYTIGSHSYTVAGTYLDTLIGANTCDSIVTTNLTVNPSTNDTQAVAICFGASYTIGAHTYSSTGFYADTFANSYGCDSIITTNLNVMPLITDTQTITFCGSGSVSVGVHTYTSAGTYTDTLVATNGCDSVVVSTLVINPTDTVNQSFTICSGDSIVVGSNVYTSTGSYTDVLANQYVCDSVVNTSLYVIPAGSSQNVTICYGGSYSIGSSTYTASGTYSDTLLNSLSCDSVVTTNLTVLNPISSNQSFTFCGTGSVVVGSHTYTTTGSYTDTLASVTGCDSIVTTDLTINPIDNISQSFTICFGQTVQVGSNIYSTTGTYVDTMGNQYGCDSIVTTLVNVIPQSTSQNITICQGQSYSIGSNTYTVAGSYTDTLQNALLCDSIVFTDLTVNPNTASSQNVTICFGASYSIGANTYNASGVYTDTFLNSLGCDSVVTTNLTVRNLISGSQSLTFCGSGSVNVGSHTYTATGTYTDTLTSVTGCDSILTTNLTINPIDHISQSFTICFGQTVQVGSNSYSLTGSYIDTLGNQFGCDSIVITDVYVIPQSTSQNVTICQGQSYSIGSNTYTVAGSYTDTLQNALLCDSIVFTDLTVNPNTASSQNVTICFGASYSIGTHTYNASGVYTDTFLNSLGCDSVVTTDLTVRNLITGSQSLTFCGSGSVTIGSHTYNTTGTYTDTLTSVTGCDSVLTTSILINPIDSVTQSLMICAGQSVQVGGSTYTTSGTFTDVLTNQYSCDSVVTTALYVIPASTSQSVAICQGQSFSIGTHTYTTAGLYADTFKNMLLCDSIVYTDLTVNPTSSYAQWLQFCLGDSAVVAGHVYKAAGTYTDTIANAFSCDSVITTTITILPQTSFGQSVTLCFGDTLFIGANVHMVPGVYLDTIPNSFGCDSIVSTELDIRPKNTVVKDVVICEDDYIQVGSNYYSFTGTYYDTLTSVTGCDSFQTTNLYVIPGGSSLSLSACFGDSVAYNGQFYSATGLYQVVLTNMLACDSVIDLDVTILPQITTDLYPVICQGTSFAVGAASYTASGDYQDTLTASVGCDSIVVYHLTVTPADSVVQSPVICQGAQVVVGGNTYTTAGDYYDTLVTAGGCDSIVVTHLTVLTVSTTSLNQSICSGDSFVVGNSVYYAAGIYADTLTGVNGCDSIITTDLSVINPVLSAQSFNLCPGQSVSVGVHLYNAAGVFTDTLAAVSGCDSIITTTVTIIPVNFSQSVDICPGQSVAVGAHVYTAAGVYTDTLAASTGCDSILVTTVNVRPYATGNQTLVLCQGQTVSVGVHTYGATGTYTDTLAGVLCDSIVTTNLTVNPASSFAQSLSVCNGQSVTVGIHTYSSAGVYTDTLPNSFGCDSIITTTLQIKNSSFYGQSIFICEGRSYTIGTHTYTLAGTYTDTLVNAALCDSIVSTELLVTPSQRDTQHVVLCANDSLVVGTHVYYASGWYSDTFAAVNTCDSIIVSDLTILPAISTTQSPTICTGASVVVGQHIYTTSGTYRDTLLAVSGCDSVVITNLTVSPIITSTISGSICNGGVYPFNGMNLSAAGVYRDTILGAAVGGCDSVVVLNLTVGSPSATTVNAAICLGSTYVFNGQLLSNAGTYRDTLPNAANCDSVITLNLVVNNNPNLGNDVIDSVCVNNTFNLNSINFGGFTPINFNTPNPGAVPPGTYMAVYIDANTCRDTAMVTIVGKAVAAAPVFVQADSAFCAGTLAHVFAVQNDPGVSYSWTYQGSDASLVQSGNVAVLDLGNTASNGTISVSANSLNGCGSKSAFINVTVAGKPGTTLTSSDADNVICAGESVTLTAAGAGNTVIYINGMAVADNPHVLTATADSVYNILAITTNACTSDSASLQVLGHASPTVDAGADTTVARGSWTQLEGSASGSPPFAYLWYPDSTLNYAIVANPLATPSVDAQYYLTVMDMYGCTATDSVKVVVTPNTNLLFPDVMTPNGDGKNDVWIIDLNQFPSAQVIIFNRWGEVVFESGAYVNDWNGTFKNNGNMLPDGTYYYAVKNKGDSRIYKGAINLLNNKK
ncbi:MAG: gliding motility-associated C-terminal domain-containing protein [Chitinophagales bacterium]